MPLTIEEHDHHDEITGIIRQYKQSSCVGTARALASEILTLRRALYETASVKINNTPVPFAPTEGP